MISENKKRLIAKIENELGPLFDYLKDETVIEIMLNPDGRILVEKYGSGIVPTDITMSREKALLLMGSVADYNGTAINKNNPLLKATMPWGQRFQGMQEPVVEAPAFTIRCNRSCSLTLDDYVPVRLSREAAEMLKRALVDRKNILVSGGTGSGKTTLTSALLKELSVLCPNDRLTIMEDTREITVASKNVVYQLAGDQVSMTDLLAANLRMRPDRIILGETRGSDAYDLLMSWNTGHPGGICTLHANTALSALARFETLILVAGTAQNLTIPAVRSLIANAVDIVIHIEKSVAGPIIKEILSVKGLNLEGGYVTEDIYKKGELI